MARRRALPVKRFFHLISAAIQEYHHGRGQAARCPLFLRNGETSRVRLDLRRHRVALDYLEASQLLSLSSWRVRNAVCERNAE